MGQEAIWSYYQNPTNLSSFQSNKSRLRYLAKHIRSSDTVLNIGVGDAGLEALLLNKGCSVSTLDPDPAAIGRLQAEFGVAPTHAKVGYSQNIPFDTSSFDVVTMSEVLEHLDERTLSETIREVRRVLKPHGRFLGTVPADERLGESYVVCPACSTEFHRWGHEQSFSASSLNSVLSKSFSHVRLSRLYLATPQGLNVKGLVVWILKKLLRRLGIKSKTDRFFFDCTQTGSLPQHAP